MIEVDMWTGRRGGGRGQNLLFLIEYIDSTIILRDKVCYAVVDIMQLINSLSPTEPLKKKKSYYSVDCYFCYEFRHTFKSYLNCFKNTLYVHMSIFIFEMIQLLKRVQNAIKVSCERNPFSPGVFLKLSCLDIWTQVGFWNVPEVNVSDEIYWQRFPCETSIKIMVILYKYPHIGLFLTIIRWNRVDQLKKMFTEV